MSTGAIVALVFAAVVILLAAILSRLTARGRRFRHDRNASRRDGDAAATWIGIRRARDDDLGPPDHP